jgi:hypothetical protein
MTTMETTRMEKDGSKVEVEKRSVAKARHTPAYPAMNPDRAKAISLDRARGMPRAPAPVSLSRTAISRRATPRSRHSRTISTDSTRMTRENQANERAEASWIPKKLGLPMSVDCGLGRPVHSSLPTTGRLQHGVARTDPMNHRLKARVLTARYRPRTRSAGRPTTTAITAVTAPANGMRRISGTLAPRWAAIRAPQATSPNCPSDTWPAQPVSTVRDRAMTA